MGARITRTDVLKRCGGGPGGGEYVGGAAEFASPSDSAARFHAEGERKGARGMARTREYVLVVVSVLLWAALLAWLLR